MSGGILDMKRRMSAGQLISLIGTLIICTGLLFNGLEIISNTVFRLIVLAGVIIHGAALAVILKRNQF